MNVDLYSNLEVDLMTLDECHSKYPYHPPGDHHRRLEDSGHGDSHGDSHGTTTISPLLGWKMLGPLILFFIPVMIYFFVLPKLIFQLIIAISVEKMKMAEAVTHVR